jgi:predicted dehydrogenase
METITNVGLIECKTPNGAFKTDALGNRHGFHLKKVMVQDASPEITRLHYPQSEIVQDKRAIMDDSSIDLIVISGAAKSDLDLVAEVLQTGKHVRIV